MPESPGKGIDRGENMSVRAKTPLFCQEALVREVERITADMRFQNPKGGDLLPLRVFSQSLPVPQKKEGGSLSGEDTIEYQDGEEEEAIFQCPWCLVKIDGGKVPEINGGQEVSFGICFGVFRDDVRNQGHREILNLISRVYERFAKNPLLDGQYTCTGTFQWNLAEEDTYPYFFGAIAASFTFTGFRREMSD